MNIMIAIIPTTGVFLWLSWGRITNYNFWLCRCTMLYMDKLSRHVICDSPGWQIFPTVHPFKEHVAAAEGEWLRSARRHKSRNYDDAICSYFVESVLRISQAQDLCDPLQQAPIWCRYRCVLESVVYKAGGLVLVHELQELVTVASGLNF